jgi:hypothetical protein
VSRSTVTHHGGHSSGEHHGHHGHHGGHGSVAHHHDGNEHGNGEAKDEEL